MRALLGTGAGRAAATVVALLMVAVAGALVLLWPAPPEARSGAGFTPTVRAEVVRLTPAGCEAIGGPGCALLDVRLLDGRFTGRPAVLALAGGEFAPPVDDGDRIRVSVDPRATPAALADPAAQALAFSDFERGRPLLALALLFGALVVALGRWQGVRSLIGLAVSLAVVVEFIVPALLSGSAPLPVALAGGLAIALATVLLTHGAGLKSAAAVLGTAVALALTALLALSAVEFTDLTGQASEEANLLQASADSRLSLQGLVIAGMVVGALGVLDDVTVSQASTVLALRRADPGLGVRRLYAEAMSVGRDHLGAVVNTLVLAYAGAALPVLLIFSLNGVSFETAVNREPVAQEVIAMLVGSIGLVAAVPLTTALAALLAVRIPPEALPADDAGHTH